MKYSVDIKPKKHIFLNQVVPWNCNGWPVTPLTDYIDDLIYQKWLMKEEYCSNSDDWVYLDLKDSRGYTNEIQIQQYGYTNVLKRFKTCSENQTKKSSN